MGHLSSWILELAFGAALFFNAILFLPQAWSIFKHKKSEEISLLTFGGFWLTQLLTVIHAGIKNDFVLFWGYVFAMITCGCVILLTVKFRYFK